MTFVLISIMAIVIVAFAAAVCIVSDRLEQRRGLNRLRKRMLLESDFSDQQFATAFSESDAADVLEMRQMLAALLGIDAVKIRPEWRFREERALRNLDYPICHAFALR